MITKFTPGMTYEVYIGESFYLPEVNRWLKNIVGEVFTVLEVSSKGHLLKEKKVEIISNLPPKMKEAWGLGNAYWIAEEEMSCYREVETEDKDDY